MNKSILRPVIILLSVAATITFNILANALPLNGYNTGEISDRFAIYFVPAGYVFSIWGLIYLGLIAYAIFQALPAQRENPRLTAISAPFILSCVANIAWLFFWHYEQFYLTLPAMLALLASLIVIYLRLGTGRSAVSAAEQWCVRIPFSVYLGWISVATIANVTQVLYFSEWKGWGVSEATWAVIMLAAAVVLGGLMSYLRRDIAYNLALAWAFVGIALKHQSAPLVSGAAWTATALALALMLLFAVFRLPRSPLPTKA